MNRFVTATLFVTLSWHLASTVLAETRHMPDDYDMIQAALDEVRGGNKIVVRNSMRTRADNRSLDFRGNSIPFWSENGPNNSIVDCTPNGNLASVGYDIGSDEHYLPETTPDSLLPNNSCGFGIKVAGPNSEACNSGNGAPFYSMSDDAHRLSRFPAEGVSTGESDTITVARNGSLPEFSSRYATITISVKIISQLDQVNLISPSDQLTLNSPPHFTWTADGGTNNRFVVDFHIPYIVPLWTTPVISETSWTMPTWLWDILLPGWPVYWRVRGADLDQAPLTIVTSDETWSFRKE